MLVNQDVVWLEVIVNDAKGVQVFQSLVELQSYHDHCFLSEVASSSVLDH